MKVLCWTARSIVRMEVLFASMQHHCFWCFFWSRGPKLCPNRTGNTKFYKNPAYMRTRVSHGPMYAQGHQETKVIFLKNFLSSFFPTSRSKIQRFSDFSIHLHIPWMYGKITKLKVATQYFALKMRNCESYFLRKWTLKKKQKKMQKKVKKTFFFF